MSRYKTVDGSQSGHCCFEATVIDTATPMMFMGKRYNDLFEPICECIDAECANLVSEALNKLCGHSRCERPESMNQGENMSNYKYIIRRQEEDNIWLCVKHEGEDTVRITMGDTPHQAFAKMFAGELECE